MTVSCYTLLIRYTYGKEHKQGGIMEIYSIKDEKFRRYGKVWSGFDCTRLIREMEHTPLPEDVIYVPSMEELEVLSEAAALPFSMSEAGNVREELRLQYRFLDLRRPKLLNNLKFRHRLTKLIHDYLDGQGFLQVDRKSVV